MVAPLENGINTHPNTPSNYFELQARSCIEPKSHHQLYHGVIYTHQKQVIIRNFFFNFKNILELISPE